MKKTTTSAESVSPSNEPLRRRAQALGLWGVLSRWSELSEEPWVQRLVTLEEEARQARSLERRIQQARIGRFTPMADFDRRWPKRIDLELLDEVFQFDFLADGGNVILVGPNGVGKTMIAKNLAHQAVLRGHTARFTTASELLNDLAAQEAGSALSRRLRHYQSPDLLVIDELGYLESSSRHADLLFEIVTRRDGERSIVLTTNKPFAAWNEMFPSAGCTVSLVDRLTHKAEILEIRADSYRAKEAQERAAERAKRRAAKRAARKSTGSRGDVEP
jgi:DNA replication protein DnaC